MVSHVKMKQKYSLGNQRGCMCASVYVYISISGYNMYVYIIFQDIYVYVYPET
jgi:hypothetical protein